MQYERYNLFHYQVRYGRYPNSKHLAERFEISQKTAQIDIEFMRDRIGAPLEFSYADVEVLKPSKLRDEIKEEIDKMGRIYK